MKIRTFQLSDYRSVSDLLEVSLSEECCKETLKALARQLSWDSELVLVAEEEEEILGVMIGTIDKQNGYVYRIAVHPDHRRRGVGRSLVTALNARFRQRNVLKVLVAVDKHNEHLQPFYERLGDAPDMVKLNRPLSIVAG
ncbi:MULTISPECIES: GNAT family N-acetyltransferase [Cohnella]|uniref:GNAT family N-acetyltransferase n=1 Tax=Cohnella TaxID=329857 RepID=UPI0009B9FB23|nr:MULTISPECIES: GNAT family N-acetyltransferase [Cohnella]MBN2982054.1 GNAT family N-acetyltransferase [Cohnella algarum]